MASQPYIVIRLVPESPVDGATFATYLDGLALQALDAHTGEPRSDLAYSSPLILIDWPGVAKRLSIVSVPTSASTDYQSANNYGSSLKFNSNRRNLRRIVCLQFGSDHHRARLQPAGH